MIGQAIVVVALLEACYAVVLAVILVKVILRAKAGRRRASEADIARPAIRDALIEYLAGSSNLDPLRGFARSHRNDLIDGLLEVHGTVSGGARERLWELALELSLVHDWCEGAR